MTWYGPYVYVMREEDYENKDIHNKHFLLSYRLSDFSGFCFSDA